MAASTSSKWMLIRARGLVDQSKLSSTRDEVGSALTEHTREPSGFSKRRRRDKKKEIIFDRVCKPISQGMLSFTCIRYVQCVRMSPQLTLLLFLYNQSKSNHSHFLPRVLQTWTMVIKQLGFKNLPHFLFFFYFYLKLPPCSCLKVNV